MAEMGAELRRAGLPAGGGKEELQARLRGLGTEKLRDFRERTMAARADRLRALRAPGGVGAPLATGDVGLIPADAADLLVAAGVPASFSCLSEPELTLAGFRAEPEPEFEPEPEPEFEPEPEPEFEPELEREARSIEERAAEADHRFAARDSVPVGVIGTVPIESSRPFWSDLYLPFRSWAKGFSQ
jgi:hypothetical protein